MAFQLGASLLEACVLAVLARGDTYGYILTQNIRSIIEISESTLYPVLRRLQKDDCLEVYDKAIDGRNRRYYRLTEQGRLQLQLYRREWVVYSQKISRIMKEGEH